LVGSPVEVKHEISGDEHVVCDLGDPCSNDECPGLRRAFCNARS
jgi:hypothetical protein